MLSMLAPQTMALRMPAPVMQMTGAARYAATPAADSCILLQGGSLHVVVPLAGGRAGAGQPCD
jgi:hypothetical protein